jgi:hypothetical protein
VAFVLFRHGTLVDFLWGMIPIALIGVGNFAYWLWRTQRTLPQSMKSGL